MTYFKKGRKVICIDDMQRHSYRPMGGLKKDEIYTVAKMDAPGVWLEEITAPTTGHYYSDRFKLLKYDIINNTNIISEIIEEKADTIIKKPSLAQAYLCLHKS